jgi:hypothetical protein
MDPSACRRLIRGYQQATGATLALRGTPIGYRVDRPDVQVTSDFHPAKVAFDERMLRGVFNVRGLGYRSSAHQTGDFELPRLSD